FIEASRQEQIFKLFECIKEICFSNLLGSLISQLAIKAMKSPESDEENDNKKLKIDVLSLISII
ncbi:hypothetical protein, partial [Clostridium sp. 3-3]|uniref:hypothetical protein n=1 Tax=Clostridium sp. 3-3 TaxID=2070757 RepID=UPI0015E19F3A